MNFRGSFLLYFRSGINMKEKVLVLDFGSQYTRLIARRIREHNVYSEIANYNICAEDIKKIKPIGIVLSGGPDSIYEKNSPQCDAEIFGLGIPVLGICYGMHLMVSTLGGRVERSDSREYGRTELEIICRTGLFRNLQSDRTIVWMSHGDKAAELPPGFMVTAKTKSTDIASISNENKKLFGIQFHPEVNHTVNGNIIINSFLYDICGAAGDWRMSDLVEEKTAKIADIVGDRRAICALSGGVDSSVTATLASKAIGDNLQCIFVDTGLLRFREAENVMNSYLTRMNLNVKKIDASSLFFRELKGVKDPEKKRKIIGKLFVDVFVEEAIKTGNAEYFLQGTLYPDVIESAGFNGPSAVIKTHHNLVPEIMHLNVIEPLRDLFKDEVRKLGHEMGMEDDFLWRHPFPGPGLAVRILGEVTPERVNVLQKADHIFIEEIRHAGLYRKISQAFAVLLPVKSVGVMGDGRTYENVLALRAVETNDFMTADWSRIPFDVLDRTATKIINDVKGINRVVYDISTKPPSTIEWE